MSVCKSATEIAMDQRQIDWQAVQVLAKQAALREVKRQIQKEGRCKVTLILAGRLGALATQYLKTHPELFQEALASPIVQNSEHSIKSWRPRNQGLLVCENRERNGWTE
jgi:hypothetical protein